MALLVSAKGSDVLAWRAAGDFAVTYRQVILDRMELCRSDEAFAMLTGTLHAIDELAAANDAFCSRCDSLIVEVAACHELARLRELTTTFYAGLYEHHDIHHSAPAFYQFSILFLQALAGSVRQHSCTMLADSSAEMPEMALIALGPAGRQEFSPFCPLQFMLVHGGQAGDAGDGLIHRFASLLHEGFQACGLQVDEQVTPRNSQWRGSISEWEQRLVKVLKRGKFSEVIEVLRLTDQTQLDGSGETGASFRQLSLASLAASPVAVNNLVSRIVALSNGIGMMGGIRFEKKGPYRGQFALLENALQPLSASVSALGLLKHIETMTTPRRVRELLWRRELNVDMSERLLQAWYTLHELRLVRERDVQPDWANRAPLHLDIEGMDLAGQESLRESLEAVGNIQRHVGLNFSGVGE
jgi:signal-transduction protein with cAMP-binding, CBS, and nucleotidyltransferase domain